MVNYHDPATIAQEYLGAMKLWHVMDGIFIWEFCTTLDFEWDFIRGRRPHRWTIWVYSIARWATLLSMILSMFGLDTTTPINCQAWITMAAFSAYLAFVASSLLLMLRVLAIWNKAKIIIAIAMTVWVADISLFVYALIRIRSTWSLEANTCTLLNYDSTKPGIVGSLITDLVLLLLMLFGLLRMRLEAGGASLGRILWKQGLMWLLLATLAEVPSTVLMTLNLNVSIDLMTQIPSMVLVTIAATRSYRGLIKFGSSDVSYETPGATGPPVSELRVRSGPIPPSRVEVTVHTQNDQYGTSQTSRYASTESQGQYKAHEVILKDDEESGLEK